MCRVLNKLNIDIREQNGIVIDWERVKIMDVMVFSQENKVLGCLVVDCLYNMI